MGIEAIPSAGSVAMSTAASPATPKTAEQAAQQFESMLIAQMLRSAREAGGAGDEEGDSEKSTMLDLSEQQFAQMLAQKGGLNLSHLIIQGLGRRTPPPAPDPRSGNRIPTAYGAGPTTNKPATFP